MPVRHASKATAASWKDAIVFAIPRACRRYARHYTSHHSALRLALHFQLERTLLNSRRTLRLTSRTHNALGVTLA